MGSRFSPVGAAGFPAGHGVDQARSGDHICYSSDRTKMMAHYPKLKLTRTLRQIFQEIAHVMHKRMTK